MRYITIGFYDGFLQDFVSSEVISEIEIYTLYALVLSGMLTLGLVWFGFI